MALGLGYGLPFAVKRPVQGFAEDVALSVNNALADAAQREEAGNCLTARAMQIMQDVQTQPSLLIVPQLYKAGVLYDQLPTTRTNFLPNNSMAGATGSVLPTTWASGSIPAGFTFSVGASGQATANDGTLVNYVDVSVSGTATASGTFNLFFSAATGAVTATTGQTFTLSAYATCISGDITTPAMVLQVQEVSGSTFQAGTSTNIALASGAALQRVSAVRTFNQSGVTASRGRIGHPIVSGTTYSYTIRIASPQLERLGVATPMIATSTGAVTRLNESTNVVGLPPDFTVSRNTTATRVNSSGLIESVASGVPRIDWLEQSCPGLLVEPSGQNLALRSDEFRTIAEGGPSNSWAANDTVIISVNNLSPDGTNNATRIRGAASPTNRARQQIITGTSGVAYVGSAWIRRVSGTSPITLRVGDAGSTTNISPTSTWQRYSFSSTPTTTTVRIAFLFPNDTDEFEIWGAQLEVGSIATTYIPTTSGTGSRAAEVISASGALVSGLIGQTEGTLYAEVDLRNWIASGRILSCSNGTSNERIIIQVGANRTLQSIVTTASANVVDISTASGQVNGVYKCALTYASGDFAFYVNGTQIGTDSSGGVPACTSVFLGKIGTSASTNLLNDRIRSAALYTTRLSNAQLAELTRL